MDKKSEKQKMIDGDLYIAADPELTADRLRARILIRKFNDLDAALEDERLGILKELLGSIGAGSMIEPPFRCDYGYNIHAGDNFYMNFGCVILDCAEVHIGNFLKCGPYVQIYTAHHPVNALERIAGPELASPITIGDNVWLGGGSIVLPGVSIGDNTTIGAGSVVSKDIPSGVVAAGNPCRVIKTI